MGEVVHVRGEGGAIQTLDLAAFLHSGLRKRLDRGDLVRVNPDGSTWTGTEPEPEPAPPEDTSIGDETGQEPGTGDGDDVDPGETDGESGPPDAPPLPAKSASRAVWAEFAISQGMERAKAADMSRGQLIAALTQPDPGE
jgi:hypothetical protein